MINLLEMRYFHGHKSTSMQFHPGVNVIKGRSHSGKTSIVRALRWALFNRPLGVSVRSHFAGKEETKVTVDFGDHYISRVRGNTSNYYLVDGKQLEALGYDVPDEVREVTQMDAVNLQSQHDPYFLIQDSSGSVAKQLNDIIGLQIIDESLKKVNSIVNRAEAEIKQSKLRQEKIEQNLDRFKNLDECERKVKELEKILREGEELKLKIEHVKSILGVIEVTRRDITLVEEWLTVEEKLKEIHKLVEEYASKHKTIVALSDIVQSIKREKETIVLLNRKVSVSEKIEEVKRLFKDNGARLSLIENIRIAIESVRSERKAIARTDTQIKAAEDMFNSIMKREKICPLCKQMIKVKVQLS